MPQGSILGPLLFLVYINDLPSHVEGVSLFADYTALLRFNECLDRLRDNLQRGINEVHQWMTTWRLRPNIAKTEILFLPYSEPTYAFTLPGSLTDLIVVKQHKHLGLVIDSDLSFSRHVNYICSKVSKAVGYLVSHCSHLPLECIPLFHHCYILPIFLYCSTAWSSLLSKSLMSTLEVHNKRILKVLFRKPSYFPSAELYDMFNTFPISSQVDRKLCIVVHSIRLDKAPPHLRKYNWFLPTSPTRNFCTLPQARTSAYIRSPFFAAYSLWLALPLSVKSSCTLKDFKANMKLVF